MEKTSGSLVVQIEVNEFQRGNGNGGSIARERERERKTAMGIF